MCRAVTDNGAPFPRTQYKLNLTMNTRAERLLARMLDNPRSRRVATRAVLAQRLGYLVYRMRTSRELTAQALAERAGVTAGAITRLEGGNEGLVPRLEQVTRLAEACGYMLSLRAESDTDVETPPEPGLVVKLDPRPRGRS